jgi:hypothetical protein
MNVRWIASSAARRSASDAAMTERFDQEEPGDEGSGRGSQCIDAVESPQPAPQARLVPHDR